MWTSDQRSVLLLALPPLLAWKSIWTRHEPLVWQLVVRYLDRLRSTGFASIGRRLRENVRVNGALGSVRHWIHVLASVPELSGHYFHEPCVSGAHCSVSASLEEYSWEMTLENVGVFSTLLGPTVVSCSCVSLQRQSEEFQHFVGEGGIASW